MKLVQSAGGRDGENEAELAPAESCALDDGEEEEIQFSQPLTAGILNRIKAMTGKVGKLQKCVNVNTVISMLIKIQPDATVCRYLCTAKSLYMFRVSQHPSSGVLKTVTAAFSTGHNTGTAISLQCGLIGKNHFHIVLHARFPKNPWKPCF